MSGALPTIDHLRRRQTSFGKGYKVTKLTAGGSFDFEVENHLAKMGFLIRARGD